MKRSRWPLVVLVLALGGVAASTSCSSARPDVLWVQRDTAPAGPGVLIARPLPGLVPDELKVVGSTTFGDEAFPRLIQVHEEDAFQNPVESFLGIGRPTLYVRTDVAFDLSGRTLMAFGLPGGPVQWDPARPYLGAIADVANRHGEAIREQKRRIREADAASQH